MTVLVWFCRVCALVFGVVACLAFADRYFVSGLILVADVSSFVLSSVVVDKLRKQRAS